MPKFGTDEATDAKEGPADSFGIRPQIGGLSGWTAGWTMTGCSGRPAATSGPGHPSERQSGFWTLITFNYHAPELAATDRCSVQLTGFRPPKTNRPKIAQSGEADATCVPPATPGTASALGSPRPGRGPKWETPQQTGHAPDAMLSRYVRDGELFVGNAVSALL